MIEIELKLKINFNIEKKYVFIRISSYEGTYNSIYLVY